MYVRMALALVLIAFAASSGVAQRAAPAPQPAVEESAVLRIPFPSFEEVTIDPHRCRDTYSFRLAGCIYETLYMYTPDGIAPCLARDFPAISEDGLNLTFKIDTKASFHPSACFPDKKGRALKASDFIYSIKRLAVCGDAGMFWMAHGLIEGLDAYAANRRIEMWGDPSDDDVAGLSAPDDETLVIKLTRPCAGIVSMLAHPCFSVMPKEAIDYFGSMLSRRAVGTGPYRLNAVSEPVLFVLKRWDGYRGEKAAFERVTFTQRVYWNEFLDGFASGEYHEMPMWAAYADRVVKDGKPAGALKDTPAEYQEWVNHGYYYLAFNMDDPIWGATDADGQALRRAVSLCLDRELAISEAGLEEEWYEPQDALLPAGTEFSDAAAQPEYGKFDAALALKTLDGCKYKGGLDPATGKALTLSFRFPRSNQYSGIAAALREGLKPLGIKLRINYAEGASYREDLCTSDDHVFVSGWFLDYEDPFNFLQLFASMNAATGSEFNNVSRYRSESFDKLFAEYERLAQTRDNKPRRQELTVGMTAELLKQQPTVPVMRLRVARLRNTGIDWPKVATQSFHDLRFTKEAE